MAAPQADADHSLRSLLARKQRGVSLKKPGDVDKASRLRELQVQARAFEQQLSDLEGKMLISQVRQRFGDQAAAAVQSASDSSRTSRSLAVTSEASSFLPASQAQAGSVHVSQRKWDLGRDGTKVGLAAAAGGAMLLIVTAGSPIALGVGLALGMGSAGAALFTKVWAGGRR